MNWNIEASDINLLSVNTGDKHGLVITATHRTDPYQVGLTPEQANLIAAAPRIANLLKRLVNNGWNDSISKEANEILNTIS